MVRRLVDRMEKKKKKNISSDGANLLWVMFKSFFYTSHDFFCDISYLFYFLTFHLFFNVKATL